MRSLLLVAAVAAAAAVEYPARRSVRSANSRFAESHIAHQARLEAYAEMYGMNVVRGKLHVFTEAEVDAAEAVMEANQGIGDWLQSAKLKIQGAWKSLKEKFSGSDAVIGENLEGAMANFKPEEQEVVSGAVSLATGVDGEKKKGFLDTLEATLTSNAAADKLKTFCEVAMCVIEPEYEDCVEIPPFKNLKEAIEKNADLNDGKWSTIIKNFAMKAALRVMIHGLSVIVDAAKMAMDALPGGETIGKILEGIHGQCEIIIGGDKYGALCFLEEIAKVAKLVKEVIVDIKARKFQDLVKYVADPQNLPHYGANDITDCVVKKVRAEYTCKPNTPKMQYLMAML